MSGACVELFPCYNMLLKAYAESASKMLVVSILSVTIFLIYSIFDQ